MESLKAKTDPNLGTVKKLYFFWEFIKSFSNKNNFSDPEIVINSELKALFSSEINSSSFWNKSKRKLSL